MKFLKLKIPPPIIMAIAGLLIFLLRHKAQLPIPMFIGLPLGLLLIIFGFGCDFAGLMEFRKAQTTFNPLNPKASSAIVDSGIYGFTRNPMYFGLVFVLIGWSIINKASFGILIIPIFIKYIETFQILPEEEILEEKFGEKYLEYKNRVRRWF